MSFGICNSFYLVRLIKTCQMWAGQESLIICSEMVKGNCEVGQTECKISV